MLSYIENDEICESMLLVLDVSSSQEAIEWFKEKMNAERVLGALLIIVMTVMWLQKLFFKHFRKQTSADMLAGRK